MPATDTVEDENPEQPTQDFVIRITNCNSVADAQLSLRRGALNIKYGPNGIGKSTIARALQLRPQGATALSELLPFKYREGSGHPAPEVIGADDIQNVYTFDDEYVSQFVFQHDEVLRNSFEVFINTDEYKQGLQEIDALFEGLKEAIAGQAEFDEAIQAFGELRDAFGVTRTGAISKASRGFKALAVGGKLDNIPEPLKGYEHFLHSGDPAGWITWQSKGTAYLEVSDNCPFCSGGGFDKATTKQVSAEYESAAVKNMSALRAVIDRLGFYFEPSYLTQLIQLTVLLEEPSPEQAQFLANLRGEIQTLLDKLTSLRALSFHALRDEERVDVVLQDMKVDLSLLRSLDSDSTRTVVELINRKLDAVTLQINNVRARIGEQKSRVARMIRENQRSINEFLVSAGYRYTVSIEPSDDTYRMILEHQDVAGHLESAARHLSYGERNAFALVLFMHHVRRDKPDLVVLDDPVSSFDKTKKFAILHELFHGRESLRGFTTLLLTHDIEPAIDIVRVGTSRQFAGVKPVVHFLSSRGGIVIEKLIQRNDIATFSQVCEENIASSVDAVIKCIYLRRWSEVHGHRGATYDVLSSLLHLREAPSVRLDDGSFEPLDTAIVVAAEVEIAQSIPGFDYAALLSEMRDPQALKAKYNATQVGYEKLQLFRIMSELNPDGLIGDDAFRKFINESFHIENEYVMQLNPREFDSVPEFVIQACDTLIEGLELN